MARLTVIVGHNSMCMIDLAMTLRQSSRVMSFPEVCKHPRDHWDIVKPWALSSSEVVILTHSETIINAIGKAIHDGLLSSGDVAIVIVSEDGEEPKRAHYSTDGALQNWPYGFLSPIAERREKGGT